MRLFEIDQGAAREKLAVYRGQAMKTGQSLVLPLQAMLKIIGPEMGISSPAGLVGLKNMIDPAGAIIQDISPDGTVTLSNGEPKPEDQDQAGSPSVDQMAQHNSKQLSPDI